MEAFMKFSHIRNGFARLMRVIKAKKKEKKLSPAELEERRASALCEEYGGDKRLRRTQYAKPAYYEPDES